MSDFLKKVEEQETAAAKSLDMERVEALAGELASLQAGKAVNHLLSTEMTRVRVFLDGLFVGPPPLKFLEDLLDIHKSREHQLEAEELPSILQEAGVKGVTLANGRKLEIKTITAATLGDEAEFTTWAEAHGCADILKVKFSVRKGEDLAAVRSKLAEAGANYTEGLDKSGLAQSLGKLARERMEAGLPLPPETALAVRVFEEARLK